MSPTCGWSAPICASPRLRKSTEGREAMFTGIVEELGELVAIEGDADDGRLTVRGPKVAEDAVHGASIAVDGVCLTVTAVDGDTFTVDVMRETFDRSTLAQLSKGDAVNL